MPRQFYTIETYGGHAHDYRLLPFRFLRLDGDELLVNEAGEYLIASQGTVQDLVRHRIPSTTAFYQTLKAKHFLYDQETAPLLDVLATKYRTKKSFLDGFTKLHIMVLTLRCDNSCHYCQVSRQAADRTTYDMTKETALRSLEWIMRSPSDSLTLEFQGGEPLLAFDLLHYVVEHAKELAAKHSKKLSLVLATNLALATDEMLRYLRDAEIKISTSLDGPAFVHNANRPRAGSNSYDLTISNIKRARECVGVENVSALMTTTQASLQYPREIVDEYVQQGFGSIFLRSINPYGLAAKPDHTGYHNAAFLAFYQTALDYIIALNRQGTNLTEIYAKILLTKILTPYATEYVDLQSPSGAGVNVLVYNYNGELYASDEGRMLAEMNDRTFRLGNVHQDSYASMISSPAYQYLMSASCNETLPGCADCAYQLYCGSDPIRNHATQGDAFGHRPTSSFCAKNMGIITHVMRLLRRPDRDLLRIFFDWIHDQPHGIFSGEVGCD
jgi:His-Xaa-Ser repeat-associated upstream radical SAM protein